jgi:hypothetical protein
LRGNAATFGLLAIASLATICLGVAAVVATGAEIVGAGDGVVEATWEVLLRLISPDQLAGQSNWRGRGILLIITLLGLLMFSTLISLSNAALTSQLERLRRGRKSLTLNEHFAILNWNEFGFRILREFAHASTRRRDMIRVAILCGEDPVDLLALIRSNFAVHGDELPHHSRRPERWISIRRGQTHHTLDLKTLAAIDRAAGAIILHEGGQDDTQVVRTVLAINAVLRQGKGPGQEGLKPLPTVTFNAASDLANTIDRRLSAIYKSHSPAQHRHLNYIPLSPDVIRLGIETQVARHRGLSAVYQDLLDFDGQELYIVEVDDQVTSFGELFACLDRAIPIAILGPEGPEMWPDWSTPLAGRKVVVLAPDFEATRDVRLRSIPLTRERRREGRVSRGNPEAFLFVEWSDAARELSQSLPRVVADGSSLTVIASGTRPQDLPDMFAGRPVTFLTRDGADPLEQGTVLSQTSHAIIFSDMNEDSQRSDARVLSDLLMCRHHADQLTDSRQRFSIVGELNRGSSRYIAGARLADDLLISDSLMAAAAVQLVMSPDLEAILLAILGPHDPTEIVTTPIDAVVTHPESATWIDVRYTLARDSGEIAIGFRRQDEYGARVLMNPDHDTPMYSGDEVVVISKLANDVMTAR